MIAAGMVWEEVAKLIRDPSKGTMIDIKNSCMMAYYDIWGKHPWHAGRESMSVTLSATAGVLLPADMAGIEHVYDSTDDVDYIPGAAWGGHVCPTWFLTDPVVDALALLLNVTVESLANAWADGTWVAAYIGEYIRFGKEPGIYKITAENTFTPRYYGPRMDSVTGVVRPAGTKKIAAFDDDNTRSGEVVDVHYWRYPPPLYDDSQDILLPSSRPLELATAIRMMGEKDRRETAADRLRAEYTSALEDAKSMNPRYMRPSKAVNQSGYAPFDMNHR